MRPARRSWPRPCASGIPGGEPASRSPAHCGRRNPARPAARRCGPGTRSGRRSAEGWSRRCRPQPPAGGSEGSAPAPRQLEPVADAPHGLDARVLDFSRGELLANLLHVHVDGSRVSGEVVAPHEVEQLAPLEHAAWMPGQQREQVELLRTKLHLRRAVTDLVALQIDLELARAYELWLVRLDLRPSQQSFSPRDELLRVKRLGQ